MAGLCCPPTPQSSLLGATGLDVIGCDFTDIGTPHPGPSTPTPTPTPALQDRFLLSTRCRIRQKSLQQDAWYGTVVTELLPAAPGNFGEFPKHLEQSPFFLSGSCFSLGHLVSSGISFLEKGLELWSLHQNLPRGGMDLPTFLRANEGGCVSLPGNGVCWVVSQERPHPGGNYWQLGRISGHSVERGGTRGYWLA